MIGASGGFREDSSGDAPAESGGVPHIGYDQRPHGVATKAEHAAGSTTAQTRGSTRTAFMNVDVRIRPEIEHVIGAEQAQELEVALWNESDD